jgi:putative chitinase
MITTHLIQTIFPNIKIPIQEFVDTLNKILPEYKIDTKERIVGFLSQTGHESRGYTKFVENLNYSAEGLCSTWPKRFPTLASAKPYARTPEKIANKVYADRMGNGIESSGDGWKYKGIGCLQLTGKANYQNLATAIGKNLNDTVAFCKTTEGIIVSACWFWSTNKLNRFCDKNDFDGLCEAINGGDIGIKERKLLKEKLDKLL